MNRRAGGAGNLLSSPLLSSLLSSFQVPQHKRLDAARSDQQEGVVIKEKREHAVVAEEREEGRKPCVIEEVLCTDYSHPFNSVHIRSLLVISVHLCSLLFTSIHFCSDLFTSIHIFLRDPSSSLELLLSQWSLPAVNIWHLTYGRANFLWQLKLKSVKKGTNFNFKIQNQCSTNQNWKHCLSFESSHRPPSSELTMAGDRLWMMTRTASDRGRARKRTPTIF